MTRPEAVQGRRLFVSYTGSDRPWAQWAAAQLVAAGYTVELDVWDWATGENVVLKMSDALARADQVVALWSPAYFERQRFTTDEWTAVMAERPDGQGQRRRLVPVRVSAVEPPDVLRPLLYRDLFGLPEAQACVELLAAVDGPAGHDPQYPFPGDADAGAVVGPKLPGTIPAVWNVPARLVGFTGRQTLLAQLRHQLEAGQTTLVAAVNGLGGVGKTSLAIEYAHLFAGEYERVWWVDAEQPELIGENLSGVAVASGWATRDASVTATWQVIAAKLRQTTRWLVVFDNVENPDHVRRWIPQGPGHVIITSRHRRFVGLATSLEMTVFTRAESITLIHTHLPTLTHQEVDALAEAVGDLPLALAQAVGLLVETAMTVSEYLTELAQRAQEVLSEGRAGGYPVSLAAAVEITLARLGPQDAAAVDLLHLAAVLAPDPIPLDWLRQAPSVVLPGQLAAVVARPLALRRALGRLADLGLAHVTGQMVQVHRLTQAVLRHTRTPDQLATDRNYAARLLAAVAPDDLGEDSDAWPAWAALLPHLLTLDPGCGPVILRAPALRAHWYLLMRGECQTSLPLAQAWHHHWRDADGFDAPDALAIAFQLAVTFKLLGRANEAYGLALATYEARRRVLGPDHLDTLRSATALADDLSALGRHQEAYELAQTTYEIKRRVLGLDHPETLKSAHNLSANLRALGRHQEAYELAQTTYETKRRVLGPDHFYTLGTATGLAVDLRALGRHGEAYELDQVTYEVIRRVLGSDHFYTLDAATGLAVDLRALGRHGEAYELDQATLEARVRVLGADHPDTLASAYSLAIDLRNLGRHQEAEELEQATRRGQQG